eukprot:4363788-Amphidinium_carterae.1
MKNRKLRTDPVNLRRGARQAASLYGAGDVESSRRWCTNNSLNNSTKRCETPDPPEPPDPQKPKLSKK